MTEPTRSSWAPSAHTDGRRALPFVVVATMTGLVGLGFLPVHALGIVAPALTQEFGLSLPAFSWGPTALFGLAALGSLALSGLLSRHEARTWVAAGLAVSAAGWLLIASAPHYPVALVGLGLCGLLLAACLPVGNRIAGEYLDPRKRGVSIGIAQSGSQISAMFVGIALPAGIVVAGWRWSVAMLAVVAAVLAAWGWRSLDPATRLAITDKQVGLVRARPLWILPFAGFAFVLGVSITAYFVFLPTFLLTHFGLSLQQAGVVVAANSVVGLLAKIVWGRICDHTEGTLGLLLVVSAGASLGMLGLAAAPQRGGAGLAVAAALLVAASGVPWPTVQMVVLVRTFQSQAVAALTGKTMTFGFLGMAAGPLAFSLAADVVGFPGAWVVAAAVTALGMGAAIAVARVGTGKTDHELITFGGADGRHAAGLASSDGAVNETSPPD